MKRLLISLLCVMAVLSLAAVPVLGAAGENGDALTVAVPVDRCPVFYQDAKTGELIGIGADLMRAAAEKAGYAVSFTPIEENTLKDALDRLF